MLVYVYDFHFVPFIYITAPTLFVKLTSISPKRGICREYVGSLAFVAVSKKAQFKIMATEPENRVNYYSPRVNVQYKFELRWTISSMKIANG